MLSQEDTNQVKQLIAQDNAANRFRITPSNRHVHNNTDAPYVYIPYVTYVGKVLSSGESSVPFPQKFNATRIATGHYFIKTDINENGYSILITPSGNAVSPTTFVSWIVETVTGGTYGTGFYITFFDTATQVDTDTDFYFLVFQISNPTTLPPAYNV